LSTVQRKPRADGLRNRAALLDAADAVFAGEGARASLTAVAVRAGVAIGTLYKHFPTRRALVGALLAERHDALFTDGLDGADGTELGSWVRSVAAHAATYRGLAELLASDLAPPGDRHDEAADRLAGDCARLAARTERLVDAARGVGRVRADVTTEDIVTLMNAGAWVRAEQGPAQADRLITAGLRGMEPGTP
jgi:AcrR family transcriptional regulator